MKQALSYLLTPLFYLFFGLILVIFQPIQVVTRTVFGAKAHDKTVGSLNFWITKCLHILGTSISFRQFRTIPTTAPVLIISNHQSMWDISPIIWKLSKTELNTLLKLRWRDLFQVFRTT